MVLWTKWHCSPAPARRPLILHVNSPCGMTYCTGTSESHLVVVISQKRYESCPCAVLYVLPYWLSLKSVITRSLLSVSPPSLWSSFSSPVIPNVKLSFTRMITLLAKMLFALFGRNLSLPSSPWSSKGSHAPKSQINPCCQLQLHNQLPTYDSKTAAWMFEGNKYHHKLSLKFWGLFLVGFWFSLVHVSPKGLGVRYLYFYIFTSRVVQLFENLANGKLLSVAEQYSLCSLQSIALFLFFSLFRLFWHNMKHISSIMKKK